MTEDLKIVIEELYNNFSVYSLKPTIDGCPCCIGENEKLTLHKKQLQNLEAEDLERYAASAMLTWGDKDDFKHFLPRIFDLLATGKLITDIFIVLGKLETAKWTEWQSSECELIKRFLLAWWTDLVQNREGFNIEAFMEISILTESIQPLLDKWEVAGNDISFKNLIDFVYFHLNELSTQQTLLRYTKISADTINKIKVWLIGQLDKVEVGFYRFEKIDKEFAERISVSYDMIKELKQETASNRE